MKFKLETITSVNIGSGDIFSPYSDYIYDNGYVYYIDHDLLIKELWKKENSEELIDQFVQVVNNQAKGNLQERFNLKNFLVEANLNYRKFVLQKIAVDAVIREEIQLNIKTGIQPYIPGSSLKGAIRTSLICYLYSGEEKGLKNKKNYIGEDILGKYSDDVLKHLMISDTQPFQEDALGIERFNRFNLENKKVTIPVVKEVIKEGSITHFRIKSKAGSSDLKGKFSFLQEGNEEELLSIINKYAKRNITIELDQLDKYSGEEINKLKDFYKRLLHDVKNVDEKKQLI